MVCALYVQCTYIHARLQHTHTLTAGIVQATHTHTYTCTHTHTQEGRGGVLTLLGVESERVARPHCKSSLRIVSRLQPICSEQRVNTDICTCMMVSRGLIQTNSSEQLDRLW